MRFVLTYAGLNRRQHRVGPDLTCQACGLAPPWTQRDECPGVTYPPNEHDWQAVSAQQQDASARYWAALEAHDALGGTPLTLEERLALRVSCGP